MNQNKTQMDDSSLSVTTPRFMEAMDFLNVESDDMNKICICGKKFNTNYGDYNTCYGCEAVINESRENEEFEELMEN